MAALDRFHCTQTKIWYIRVSHVAQIANYLDTEYQCLHCFHHLQKPVSPLA